MVEQKLPKLTTRVRFPSPAPHLLIAPIRGFLFACKNRCSLGLLGSIPQMQIIYWYQDIFIAFIAGLPRKPKLPFADWYSTYARCFSKVLCSFPAKRNSALLPIASAIPQNGAIRFVWQSLSPHPSIPVLTKQIPCPCNHCQQGFFVPRQDYPAHVPRLAGTFSIGNIRRRYRKFLLGQLQSSVA